jgi:hypothetical protein
MRLLQKINYRIKTLTLLSDALHRMPEEEAFELFTELLADQTPRTVYPTVCGGGC